MNQIVKTSNKAKKTNAIYWENEQASQPSWANPLASHSYEQSAHVSAPSALIHSIY